jgi:hypothetical protein
MRQSSSLEGAISKSVVGSHPSMTAMSPGAEFDYPGSIMVCDPRSILYPPEPAFGQPAPLRHQAGGEGSRRSPHPGRPHHRSVRSRMPVLSAIIFVAVIARDCSTPGPGCRFESCRDPPRILREPKFPGLGRTAGRGLWSGPLFCREVSANLILLT